MHTTCLLWQLRLLLLQWLCYQLLRLCLLCLLECSVLHGRGVLGGGGVAGKCGRWKVMHTSTHKVKQILTKI